MNSNQFFLPTHGALLRKNLDNALYIARTGYSCRKIMQNGVRDDQNFGDFRGPEFTNFSMEGSGRKHFGKFIGRVFKYHACIDCSYLLVLLEN